jgi:hypothetical protein
MYESPFVYQELGGMTTYRSFRLTPSRIPSLILEIILALWSHVTMLRLLAFLLVLSLGGLIGFHYGKVRANSKLNHEIADVEFAHLCANFEALTCLRYYGTNAARWRLETQLDYDIIAVCSALTNATYIQAINYRDELRQIQWYRTKNPVFGAGGGVYEMMGSSFIARDALAKATKQETK